MIQNIRHVGIVVPNLKKGIEFYKQLGLKVYKQGLLTGKQAYALYRLDHKKVKYVKMITKDGELLELYEIKNEEEVSRNHHIAFTVDNITKALDFFNDKGFVLSTEIVEIDNHKLFFAVDPWKNLIEIVEPPNG